MRAMWKGSISFGLVSVPVKMYTATQSHDVSFDQVHREDGGRIRHKRICSVCGQEVAYADIAKGHQTPDGQTVILTDDDLAELPASAGREIEVERFIPAEQIDPMLLEKSYYLEPETVGRKAYALLREVLGETDRMALVQVAIRNRATLAVLRVRDDVIVLQTMMWPDEVRDAEFEDLPGGEDLRPQEIAMANSLVDSLTGDYDPSEFTDDYREAVEALVQSKLEAGDTEEDSVLPGTDRGEVIDLLVALQKSVAEAKTARAAKQKANAGKSGARSGPAATTAKTGTGRKMTAKKAARKTAAKKATKKSA